MNADQDANALILTMAQHQMNLNVKHLLSDFMSDFWLFWMPKLQCVKSSLF